jgi:hypothetical protein
MPVSLSPETRVPRQVAERAARALERYKPAEPDPLIPAAAADPASPPAAAAATTVDPTADPRHADPAYWKARFDVTSGLLAKERENRSVERNELNRQNASLLEKLRLAPTAKAASAEIDLTKFFTPQEIETYGEPQCRVMAQTATTAAIASAQELITAEVRPLREQNERREAEAKADAQTRFEDALTAAWPLWRAEDLDQKWRDWLAEEGDDGAVRQEVLNIHIANREVPKIMRLRKVYEKLQAPPVPVPPIVPSGSGAAPSIDADPPSREDVTALTYPTKVEIAAFYKRAALGKVQDDERTKFDARLKLGAASRR